MHFCPRAHVSFFLGPRQPFPSKHQIAPISISDGNEKKASRWDAQAAAGSPDALFESGPQQGEWDVSRNILPSYPRFSAVVFAPGSAPSPRVHLRPSVSAWKSSHPIRLALSQNGGECRKSDLGPMPLPTCETRTPGHNSRRRHTKHDLSVSHALA